MAEALVIIGVAGAVFLLWEALEYTVEYFAYRGETSKKDNYEPK